MELKYRDEVENEIIDILEKIGQENIVIHHNTGANTSPGIRRCSFTVYYDEKLRK